MSVSMRSEMRVLKLENYHEYLAKAVQSLRVTKKTTPRPGPGQVLVQVEASPCNSAITLSIVRPDCEFVQEIQNITIQFSGGLESAIYNPRINCPVQMFSKFLMKKMVEYEL